ncbi:tetratricopeptide repeat protein [Paludibacterium denitrificans]|uniref:Tetratricopeptide repeat protein n=1 Tax=Paludibacterium denitrificans TaxID=2675226 RepID=A0A844GDM9_9NEIS|nr:tetratricopeptide repeat protein [Paludibacterium denitrificans]MTD33027.1 tetratricopeptide repeat protein [Paludibacterium denitrificans]
MALQPASASVLNNRGSAYLMLHQVDDAISDFKQALELEPGYADAYCNLGNAFTELNRFEAARLALQQALALDPSMADAHLALGNALDGLQRFDEAVASFDAAIQLNPRYAAAFCNKGNALRTLARYDEALACYERALKLQPADVAAMRGKANTLVGLQRYPEALAQFDRALALEADQALTRFDKGLLLLLLGDYASGWALYEARKQHEKLARYTCNLRQFDWPEWQGERELAGKTLVLHQEQGPGDTLQMLRYVPLLAELGAKVVLLVSAPLQRMAASVRGPAGWLRVLRTCLRSICIARSCRCRTASRLRWQRCPPVCRIWWCRQMCTRRGLHVCPPRRAPELAWSGPARGSTAMTTTAASTGRRLPDYLPCPPSFIRCRKTIAKTRQCARRLACRIMPSACRISPTPPG